MAAFWSPSARKEKNIGPRCAKRSSTTMPARFAPSDSNLVPRQGDRQSPIPFAVESPLGRAQHHSKGGHFYGRYSMGGYLRAVRFVAARILAAFWWRPYPPCTRHRRRARGG